MTTFARLTPHDSDAWRRWPDLEARVRAFCAVHTPDTPIEAVIAYLRHAFLDGGEHFGAWLIHDAAHQPCGHMVGWVDVHWGQPYILIHQTAIDPGQTLSQTPMGLRAALEDWARRINRGYADAGSMLRVTTMRWMTTRPAVWRRYFGSTPTQEMTVLSLPISAREGE